MGPWITLTKEAGSPHSALGRQYQFTDYAIPRGDFQSKENKQGEDLEERDLAKFRNRVTMVRRIHGNGLPGPTTKLQEAPTVIYSYQIECQIYDNNTGLPISKLIQDTMSVAHFNLKDQVVKNNLNDRDGFPLKLLDSTKSRNFTSHLPQTTDLTNPGLTQRWQTQSGCRT